MKKSLLLGLMTLLFACDDGDLTIDTIDFDSVAMQSCTTTDINTTVFFKINGDEALILELQSGLLLNEVSTTAIQSTIGTNSKLTYRVFSDDVTNTYFCSGIPLTTPTVLSEIEAVNGIINIITEAVEDDPLSFKHTITLSEVTFQEADTNSRITDLTINNFGSITTKKDTDLTISTVDFDSIDIQNCDTATTDTTVFFKINGDEALILELQSGLLLNEASTTAIESTIDTDSKLTYRKFSEDVTSAYFCSKIPLTTPPTVLNEIEAINGTISITTEGVADDPLSFKHTITLSEVTFATDDDTTNIDELKINNFGSVTTKKLD